MANKETSMAHHALAWRGLKLQLTANRQAAEVSACLSGRPWRWLTRGRQVAEVQRSAPRTANAPLPDVAPTSPVERQALVDSVTWYHSIDLGEGLVTPGQFDHRPLLPQYRLPEQLDGQRVLDVATFDGYWAFEFERRGAAEVVALDLDRPAELDLPHSVRQKLQPEQLDVCFGRGFDVARLLLNSRVRRVPLSVYSLDSKVLGMFDLVHVGDLLSHLANPILALQRVAAMCRDQALVSEVYFPELEHPWPGCRVVYLGGQHDATWWRLGLDALRQMTLDAGFRRVELLGRFKYGQRGMPQNMNHAVLRAWK